MSHAESNAAPKLPTSRVGVLGAYSTTMISLLLDTEHEAKQRFVFYRDIAVMGDARPDGVVLITSATQRARGPDSELFRVIESGVGLSLVIVERCAGVEGDLDRIEQEIREHIEEIDGQANDLRFVRVDAEASHRGDPHWVAAAKILFEELDRVVSPRDLSHCPVLLGANQDRPLRDVIVDKASQFGDSAELVFQGSLLRGSLGDAQFLEDIADHRTPRARYRIERVLARDRTSGENLTLPLRSGSLNWLEAELTSESQSSPIVEALGEIGSIRLVSRLRGRVRRGWSDVYGFSDTPFEPGERLYVESSPGWFHATAEVTHVEQLPAGQGLTLSFNMGPGNSNIAIDNSRDPLSMWLRGERCGAILVDVEVLR